MDASQFVGLPSLAVAVVALTWAALRARDGDWDRAAYLMVVGFFALTGAAIAHFHEQIAAFVAALVGGS